MQNTFWVLKRFHVSQKKCRRAAAAAAEASAGLMSKLLGSSLDSISLCESLWLLIAAWKACWMLHFANQFLGVYCVIPCYTIMIHHVSSCCVRMCQVMSHGDRSHPSVATRPSAGTCVSSGSPPMRPGFFAMYRSLWFSMYLHVTYSYHMSYTDTFNKIWINNMIYVLLDFILLYIYIYIYHVFIKIFRPKKVR